MIKVSQGIVRLALPKQTRVIGKINDATKTLEVKRVREKHLMRANNSYGFNSYVIENAKRFDKVLLNDNFGAFLIPLEVIRENGTFLHFLKQGFEKQTFLNLNYINQYKIESV